MVWRRVLLFAMIGCLLQSSVVSPACLDELTRPSGAHSGLSNASTDADSCCAFCLCCHLAIASGPATPVVVLAAGDFDPQQLKPLAPQLRIRPLDQPPRARPLLSA
jgi:hypothetical protein